MSSLLDKKIVKDDRKFLVIIVLVFLFLIWLFLPSGNNIAKIGYWANNLTYRISCLFSNKEANEYLHERDNAIAMARIYPHNNVRALRAINTAIVKVPTYISESELSSLYRDRARIKLYYGDKEGAIKDFVLAKGLDIHDDLRMAILMTEKRKYSIAGEYCKDILKQNPHAFSGYACYSYVNEALGRNRAAISFYDYAIKLNPSNALAYVERANLKKRMNDTSGYNQDITQAKNMLPNIDVNKSIIKESVKPENIISNM